MTIPNPHHPDSTERRSKPELTDEQEQQAYIEERIRLGLAEQSRIRTGWEDEDQAEAHTPSLRKRRAWAVTKGLALIGFGLTCVGGWFVTLWQPPSGDVLINYLCLAGLWVLVMRFVRWSTSRLAIGRNGRVLFLVTSFCLMIGIHVVFDHYRVEYQYDNGATVVERVGRMHALWNERQVVMPERFASLRSMHGPITRAGSRHGKWVFAYRALPSQDRWYWEDEEVTEQEWKQRDAETVTFR